MTLRLAATELQNCVMGRASFSRFYLIGFLHRHAWDGSQQAVILAFNNAFGPSAFDSLQLFISRLNQHVQTCAFCVASLK